LRRSICVRVYAGSFPDRVFFACGACPILAYAFLERYPAAGFAAVWMKPGAGHTGNHIVVVGNTVVFDYHEYSRWAKLLAHTRRKADRRWPGWSAEPIELQTDVLVSEARSRQYKGLWLREPKQFLHDALPRARAVLEKFPAPA